MPAPLPFITGHSLKLSAWDKVLVDNDFLAVISVLPGLSRIEEADLEGNTVLTDRSLVPFLQGLFGDLASASLRTLSLKSCRQAGHGTLQAVARLLAEERGARGLLRLDLGGIAVAAHLHPTLCAAIRAHPSLQSVCLADVGLGIKSLAAKRSIADLLGSKTIQELDIGWNCFTAEVFKHLAEQLLETQRLQSLSIANCSVSTNTAGDAPSLFFLEQLCNDRALTQLDISLNRINFCGALVVEDALERHSKLGKLIISHNPLGVLGMRSILRLLSRSSSGLVEFACEGCSNGPSVEAADVETQIFNATNPGGRYRLDLARPYHRAVLRMLYKACERFDVTPSVAFADIVYAQPPYRHPGRNGNGMWLVPDRGSVQITFSVEKGMEAAFRDLEEAPFAELLERHYDLTRLRPSLSKAAPLFAQWKGMAGHTQEQLVVLRALSKDFRLTYPQIEMFGREKVVFSEMLRSLLHCVVGGQASQYLCVMLTPTLGQFIENLRACAQLLAFNIENPTGHYRLQLENCSDYAVAEKLVLIDRWEATLCRKMGRPPVSQKGDYTRVRNERYDDRKLHGVQTIAEWRLPTLGQLELDYVSARRSTGLVVLERDTFDRVLVSLHLSPCSSQDKVSVMRAVSHLIGVSSLQLRELMGALQEDYVRAELFVCFIMRVTDIHNEKVFRVRFAGCPDLMKQLRQRLGEVTLFPFIQPEQASFSFDLAVSDERLAASLLIYIAAREGENFRSLRNPKYVKADGSGDRQFETSGVSRSWEDPQKIYDSGTFSCSYVCSPSDVQWEKRVALLEQYAQWRVEVARGEVMWWAALTEAPPDVLEFLEFLVSHYDNVWDSFKQIDGPNGNGSINLREFEESMSKVLGCSKFKGANEKQRIANIFRYLDPSGEGDISIDEWGALDHLWKEMQHSIREFVQFLERIYSGEDEDFLDIAWRVLELRGSINEREWAEKVLKKWEYFGPSEVIFRFLDKDDEGSISLEEFRALHVFRRGARKKTSAAGDPHERAG